MGEYRLRMRFGLTSLPTDTAEMFEATAVSEQSGCGALYAADYHFAYFAPDWPFLDGWTIARRAHPL